MLTTDRDPELDRILFEEAPVGLAFLDRDLRYLRLNDALARINGLPIETHLGRTVEELWPDLDPRVIAALRTVLETGVPIEGLELEAVTPADPGTFHAFVHSYHAVRDGGGAIVGLNCSVVDVSAQRRAEVAARRAREAAELLASLNAHLAAATTTEAVAAIVVEAIPSAFGGITAGLFLLDPSRTRLVAAGSRGYSDEVLANFGSIDYDLPSPAADAMRAARLLVWPSLEAIERAYPTIGPAIREVTGERAIATVPLLVGSQAIGALHVGWPAPHVPSADELDHLRAVGDVAGQAIARIRLVEAERHARRMLVASLDQLPVAVLVADHEGRLLLGNAESRRIWQGFYHDHPVTEFPDYPGFHEDGRPYAEHEWPLNRSIATGEVVVDEDITIETFDGRRRIVEDRSAPILDEDGTRIGGVVVFDDVTEKRAASRVRDAFLGMLSHELRTPVTSIYAAASMLASRGERLAPEVRESLVEDVEAEANRLVRMVDNLLVLARAERGATVIEPVPLLLDRTARQVAGTEGPSWPSLELSVEAPAGLPPVLADEALVEVILRNVIGNAAKYAPGPVSMALGRDGDFVTLAVRDHGPGIGADDLEAVFELFRRGSATSDVAPGAGIGLFIVRHLAESMGGRAWAANRPGGGAEIGIALPIDPDALGPEESVGPG